MQIDLHAITLLQDGSVHSRNGAVRAGPVAALCKEVMRGRAHNEINAIIKR